jgi:hypothetical protein
MDDYRVLLWAPTRRDREATLELLRRAGIEVNPYEGARLLAAEIETSVGAILMTDAAFIDPHINQLLAALSRQPPWSDVPVVLLCHSGTSPPITNRVLDSLRNVTLLERPSSSRISSLQRSRMNSVTLSRRSAPLLRFLPRPSLRLTSFNGYRM